jgi:hypothetical protein
MATREELFNTAVDAEVKEILTLTEKATAYLTQQGLRTQYASQDVVASDSETTEDTTYFQYSDGTVKKIEVTGTSDGITTRYIAASGTLWADRDTATYTAETI